MNDSTALEVLPKETMSVPAPKGRTGIKNGSRDWIIQDAINRGLRLDGGKIILPSGKPAKVTLCDDGYNWVCLCTKPHKSHRFLAAKIICWIAHGPPPSSGYVVDHINRKRSDDRPENLRWLTHADNIRNCSPEWAARRTKLLVAGNKSRARFTPDIKEEIRRRYDAGGVSQKALASEYRTTQSQIWRLIRGV